MFKAERETFKKVKYKIQGSSQEKVEFEKALEKLLYEYDTSNWENRFVVGGALEVLFCALLNSLGFYCRWINEARFDLQIEDVKFSLKSNFTGSGNIRLINVLSEEKVSWKEATLFFISELGICYADPCMKLETKMKGDALVIDTSQIKSFVQELQDWLIEIKIPRKPKRNTALKTASFDVAKAILLEMNSQYLLKNLPSLKEDEL
ncbi:hypothetical protein H5T87_06045 [bacterium]|nr:hypothetical protein [bacterium]